MSDGVSKFFGSGVIFFRGFIFSLIFILLLLFWFFYSSPGPRGTDFYLGDALIDDSTLISDSPSVSFELFSEGGPEISSISSSDSSIEDFSVSALPAPPTPPLEQAVSEEGHFLNSSANDLFKEDKLVVVRSSSDVSSPLTPAPVGDLVEMVSGYLLPKRSDLGMRSFEIYARPPVPLSPSTVRGRIALLIGGMGLSDSLTRSAIRLLPGSVSFAFAPYGDDVSVLATFARDNGHEIFLQMPMEPYGWPETNPGLHTLLVDSSTEDNLSRLYWHMSRFSGYVGISNYMGSRFLSLSSSVGPILNELHVRGLSYFDDGSVSRNVSSEISSVIGLPYGRADFIIDLDSRPGAIDLALRNLEQEALDRGLVIGVGSALPSTLEGLERWLRGLSDRGITLVPISSVLQGSF